MAVLRQETPQDDSTTRQIQHHIQAAIAQCPLLIAHGIDVYSAYRRPPDLYATKFAEGRATLLAHTEEFVLVSEFLAQIRKQKTFCRISSYGLKHIAEGWLGTYIMNGTLIAAALSHGYPWKRCHATSPNAVFGMSLRDIQRLSREARQKRS